MRVILQPERHTLENLQAVAALATEFPGGDEATLVLGERQLSLGDGVSDSATFRAVLREAVPGLVVEDG